MGGTFLTRPKCPGLPGTVFLHHLSVQRLTGHSDCPMSWLPRGWGGDGASTSPSRGQQASKGSVPASAPPPARVPVPDLACTGVSHPNSTVGQPARHPFSSQKAGRRAPKAQRRRSVETARDPGSARGHGVSSAPPPEPKARGRSLRGMYVRAAPPAPDPLAASGEGGGCGRHEGPCRPGPLAGHGPRGPGRTAGARESPTRRVRAQSRGLASTFTTWTTRARWAGQGTEGGCDRGGAGCWAPAEARLRGRVSKAGEQTAELGRRAEMTGAPGSRGLGQEASLPQVAAPALCSPRSRSPSRAPRPALKALVGASTTHGRKQVI